MYTHVSTRTKQQYIQVNVAESGKKPVIEMKII